MTSFQHAIVLSVAVVLAAPVGHLAAQPAKAGAKGMPADLATHHQMMEARMESMQTMMEMMMQRLPAMPAEGK